MKDGLGRQRTPHSPSLTQCCRDRHLTDTHRLWVILLILTGRGTECQEDELTAILLLLLVPLALLIPPLHMLTQCTDMLNFFSLIPQRISYMWIPQKQVNRFSDASILLYFSQCDGRIPNSWRGMQTTAFWADPSGRGDNLVIKWQPRYRGSDTFMLV